jgi:hypothetical protein
MDASGRLFMAERNRLRLLRYGRERTTYVGKHTGLLVVLGSAANGLVEIEQVRENREKITIATVGHAAASIKATFVVSDHYEVHEELKRLQSRFGDNFTTHCSLCSAPEHYPAIDHWWNWPRPSCTSAWTAIRMGLHLRFDEIILCGIPMTFGLIQHHAQRKKDGCTWPPPQKLKHPQRQAPKTSVEVLNEFRSEFVRQCLEFEGRVFSMSGFTRDVLGLPVGIKP